MIFSTTVCPMLFSFQTVAGSHGLYQTACIDDLYQILRKRGDRILLSLILHILIDGHSDGISLFHIITKICLLNQK